MSEHVDFRWTKGCVKVPRVTQEKTGNRLALPKNGPWQKKKAAVCEGMVTFKSKRSSRLRGEDDIL